MNNLDIYNAVRTPPKEALKPITAGRMKGKTDINPMWRIKTMTERFGPCGIGWSYEITRQWMETSPNGEIAAFCNILMYYKQDGEWSRGIPGTGGSMFVSNEKNGPYTSDECYKMALTDALSVACKALGVAGDIYWQNDPSKYSNPPEQPQGYSCHDCGRKIADDVKKDGSPWHTGENVDYSRRMFGRTLCPACQRRAYQARKDGSSC